MGVRVCVCNGVLFVLHQIHLVEEYRNMECTLRPFYVDVIVLCH